MPTFAFYIAPGDWRDRIIRAATGHPESHVEYLTAGPVKAANVTVSASKRDGHKVRCKIMEWTPGHWEFVEVPGHAGKIHKRIIPEVGKRYDTLGALLCWTPINLQMRQAWFCSELMAYAMGLPDPHHYTPGSFRAALMDMGGNEI